MSSIQMFNNGEFELRLSPSGDSYTVAAPGLARALGFHSAKDMLRAVPDNEKGWEIAPTLGGEQRAWHLTEAGFYRVVGQRQPSRVKDPAVRDQVMRFQSWVYREVLPSIRRTGGYQIGQPPQVYGVVAPNVLTYDEVCAELRQYFGINLTVNELTRNLRAGGVLKQNGSPTKKHAHLFWWTGTSWNVHRHVVPQVAYKVTVTGRELQDFRFLQARLEMEGVGQDLAALDSTPRRGLP